MQQENVRALAATILKRLLDGSGSLSFHLARHKEHKDYSLLQEICFGSCRSYYALEFLVDELLDKPLKKKLYFLHFMHSQPKIGKDLKKKLPFYLNY